MGKLKTNVTCVVVLIVGKWKVENRALLLKILNQSIVRVFGCDHSLDLNTGVNWVRSHWSIANHRCLCTLNDGSFSSSSAGLSCSSFSNLATAPARTSNDPSVATVTTTVPCKDPLLSQLTSPFAEVGHSDRNVYEKEKKLVKSLALGLGGLSW